MEVVGAANDSESTLRCGSGRLVRPPPRGLQCGSVIAIGLTTSVLAKVVRSTTAARHLRSFQLVRLGVSIYSGPLIWASLARIHSRSY